MHVLTVNQKLISIREHYTIDDEEGRPVYHVSGSLFKIPKYFVITDLLENELARVTRQVVSLLPKFFLDIDGERVATIQKKLSVLRPKYEVLGEGIQIKGNLFDMNFTIEKDGRVIGRIDKKWLAIRDQYRIEVDDEQNELLVIGLVLAIDYVKKIDNEGANS